MPRELYHGITAEDCLLGAVLSGYRRIDALTQIVEPGDFDAPLNEAIWREILDAANTGGATIDPVVIKDRFDKTYGLGKAPVRWDGPLYLFELMEKCPVPGNAPYYAWMVADAAARRGLQSAARRIDQLAESGLEPMEVSDRAREALEHASVKSRPPELTTVSAAFERFMDTLDQQGDVTVIESPWPDLNRLVSRFRPGQLVIVGATPSVGKSLVGTNLAQHLADHQVRTLFSTLEMSESEVLARLIAARCSVDLGRLISGNLAPEHYDRIAQHHREIAAGPLTIEQAANQTVSYISGRVAATEAQVTIVDYLQLVRPTDAKLPRHEQVAQVSRDLKLMAKQRDTCVIAAAQLNRESVKRGARPSMADLRESGGIEADADIVLLLHRPDPDIPELQVVVEKNRNGPKGELTLHVVGHYARIVNAYTRAS